MMLFWIPVETVCEFEMEFGIEIGMEFGIEFGIDGAVPMEFMVLPAEFIWNLCFFAGMGKKLNTCFS